MLPGIRSDGGGGHPDGQAERGGPRAAMQPWQYKAAQRNMAPRRSTSHGAAQRAETQRSAAQRACDQGVEEDAAGDGVPVGDCVVELVPDVLWLRHAAVLQDDPARGDRGG